MAIVSQKAPPSTRKSLLDVGALILNSNGRCLKLLQVLVSMVSTEQKLAIRHDRAHVGLCAAGITAIRSCQRLLVNHCCVHIIIKAFRSKNIPTLDCEFTPGEIRDRLSCATTIDGGQYIFTLRR